MAMTWNYSLHQWEVAYHYKVERWEEIKHLSMAEREIEVLKWQYVEDEITVEELDEQVGNWLKWETLGPLERRQFELDIAKSTEVC